MWHLQPSLSIHTHPLWVPSFSLTTKCRIFGFSGYEPKKWKWGTNFYSHRAVEERDSEFEVDPDKAREALRKLDQQLQSLSEKQTNPSKIRASELNGARNQMTEVPPEYSGSFLAYSAFVLLIFTIFYNVLFFTVIQPSIDGPEQAPAITSVREASEAALSQKLPTILE